jgi:hypothetical protein
MTKPKQTTRTDLKALDAHIPRKPEYQDAPELTDVQLQAAKLEVNGRPVISTK